jgi:hypothetical protein
MGTSFDHVPMISGGCDIASGAATVIAGIAARNRLRESNGITASDASTKKSY